MIKDANLYHILIIEDNPGDAALIEEYLHEQFEKLELQFATHFSTGKEMVVESGESFDVILLDLTLPDRSGKETVTEILAISNLKCPVIILSGSGDFNFSKDAIQFGISDFLVKDQLNSILLYKSIIYSIERHKYIQRTEESEKKFSALFELSPQPMWIYDVETLQFVKVNRAAVINYGYTEDELLHMTLPDLVVGITKEYIFQVIEDLKAGKIRTFAGVSRHRKKSGEVIDVEVFNSIITINKSVCGSTIAIDITERKNAERALRASEEKYRNAERIGRMGNWELELATGLVSWSDEIFSIFDIEKSDGKIALQQFFQSIHPDDKDAFKQATKNLDKPLNIIHRIIHRNGEVRYLHELGELVKNSNGEVTHFRGTVQDVTQQVENEAALRQSEARLQGIINSQTNYVVRTDLSGHYTYYNHNFYDEFGWIYGSKEIIGQNSLLSFSEYDHEKAQKVIEQCIRNPSTVFQIELDKPGKGNVIRSTLWDFVCLTDENGQPTELQCVGIDITDWKKAERQLVKTLAERNTILESIGDAFFAINREWIVTYWNNEAEKLSGVTRDEIVGKSFADKYPEWKQTIFFQRLQEALEKDKPTTFEFLSYRFKLWLEVSAFPTENGMAVYLKDITERKQHQEEILNNERKLQVLFDTVSEIIFMIEIESQEKEHYRLISVNKAGLSTLGVRKEQLEGKYLHHIIPPTALPLVFSYCKEAILSKKRISWKEEKTYTSGMKAAWVSISPVYNEDGNCILLVGSVRDITEQLAYEEKLKSSAEELRQLAQHLQDVREDERSHIAREIHDQLGQQLTGIKMDLSWLKRKIANPDDSIQQKIKESITLVDDTLITVRKIAAELRPSIIDDLGLKEAVDWLSDDFAKRSGIPVKCHIDLDQEHYHPKIAIAVFRIYQESLTNILRHANATEVSCRLEEFDNNLQLTVADNGVGFDSEKHNKKRTLGLLGMKERVTQLNGQYTINSKSGKGTVVSVTVPVGNIN